MIMTESKMDKVVITTGVGAILGVVAGSIWSAVEKKGKRPHARIYPSSTAKETDGKHHPLRRIDEAKLPGTNPLEAKDYTYPGILNTDRRLADALDTFRERRGTSRQLFMVLVTKLHTLSRLWYKCELVKVDSAKEEDEDLIKSAAYEATHLCEQVRASLETLCKDSGIPCRPIPGYHFKHGPVNPQFRRAFTEVLKAADNYRHNCMVACESKKRHFMHNRRSSVIDRKRHSSK